jgi:hypothetical protein
MSSIKFLIRNAKLMLLNNEWCLDFTSTIQCAIRALPRMTNPLDDVGIVPGLR